MACSPMERSLSGRSRPCGTCKPAMTNEVAVALAATKGIEDGDPRMPEIRNRVSSAMNDLSKRGRVKRSVGHHSRTVFWEIAR